MVSPPLSPEKKIPVHHKAVYTTISWRGVVLGCHFRGGMRPLKNSPRTPCLPRIRWAAWPRSCNSPECWRPHHLRKIQVRNGTVYLKNRWRAVPTYWFIFGPFTNLPFLVWWLNQPLWKIWVKSGSSSPSFGVKMKNVWNHHLVLVYFWTLD